MHERRHTRPPQRGWLLLVALCLGAAVTPPSRALTLLTEDNPPFNYLDDKGKLTGLVTELVIETMQAAGVPYTMEVLRWQRAFERARSEPDTCLFAVARLESREPLFRWVGPFASNAWGAYGKGDFAGRIRALRDLAPYRIGVTGEAKAEYLGRHGVTNVERASDERQNPARLLLPQGDPKRIDLWVAGYYSAREAARAAHATDVKLVFVTREIPLYLACSRETSPDVVARLARALERLRAQGVLDRATRSYARRFAL